MTGLGRSRDLVRFEGFELDLRAGELRAHGGKTIRLSDQPFQILTMLVQHPGEVVAREEIRRRLWPNDTIVEFEHSISAAMNRVRQALGDSADNPRYIETLARRGYRWMVSVAWVDLSPASPSTPAANASQRKEPEPRPGKLIGKEVCHYRVTGMLGGGGMGVVYKAEDIRLGRSVALKFLPEELADDRTALERFERESRAASALDHPNICTIYGVEEYEGRPFIVMQLLEGETLRRLIERRRLTTDEILRQAIQISDGLDVAHRKGIIHRDIKPANIFVCSEGQVKLLDFGLAKLLPVGGRAGEGVGVSAWRTTAGEENLTIRGTAMGSVAYMSPEQARGEELDARTDLYSFGAVLYEMSTGKQAFSGSTAAVIFHAILAETPVSPISVNSELPPELVRIINKALEKDRDLRYQRASEMRSDLKGVKREAPAPVGASDGIDKISSGQEANIALDRRPNGVKTREVPDMHGSLRLVLVGGFALLLVAAGFFGFMNRQPSSVGPPELKEQALGANRQPSSVGPPELKEQALGANSSENPVKTGAIISPDSGYLASAELEGIHIADIVAMWPVNTHCGVPHVIGARSLRNNSRGEVNSAPEFHYHENGGIVWAEYEGGTILRGTLLAKQASSGAVDMRFQHVNRGGEILTGLCHSESETLPDKRHRLREHWTWTSGQGMNGESVVEEVNSR